MELRFGLRFLCTIQDGDTHTHTHRLRDRLSVYNQGCSNTHSFQTFQARGTSVSRLWFTVCLVWRSFSFSLSLPRRGLQILCCCFSLNSALLIPTGAALTAPKGLKGDYCWAPKPQSTPFVEKAIKPDLSCGSISALISFSACPCFI